jgi:hypothetical protein
MIRMVTWTLVAGAVAAGAAAQEASTPYTLPIPEGWRTEIIPFPLSFAPELPYTGVEELRFSPGMFEEGSEGFWSYAFIWWVPADHTIEPATLETHLRTYFRGLALAVAEARKVDVGAATFAVSLRTGPGGFVGHVETFDAFVTHGQLRLNLHGGVLRCPQVNRQAIFFALSPQESDSPVWSVLSSIRDGFLCGVPG